MDKGKRITVRVQAESFDPGAELNAFKAQSGDVGAIANFVGYVRGQDGGVSQLRLDHYPGFTEKQIDNIAQQMIERFDVDRLLVIHRHGAMAPEEPIVFVAASGQHRAAAFQAVECLMDYLKTDAPFWKCETGPNGEAWIEPRDDDRQSRSRWGD